VIAIITQCFPPDHGGIETLMGQMALALHKAGREVVVLADHVRGGGAEPAWPFPVRRFNGPRPWRRWRKARAIAALRPTAVMAESWKSLEALPGSAPRTVVLAHGNELLRGREARMRAALGRAAVVVANSAYTAGLLDGLHGHVVVVNLPLAPPAAAIRATPPGRRIIGIGRLEPRKGFDRVIEALAHLPGASFELIGAGGDLTRLAALAVARGVADRVLFRGAVGEAEKAQALADADVFAMPARQEGTSVEGYGLVYLEAAGFGLPSLAGTAGGAADAVLHGETGLVVDGADPAAVQEALATLLDDTALRRRLGDAARNRVVRDLSWESTLPRYLSLLEPSSVRSD
jgi:phosphatidyl-myo-inositol dimannoside synthase